MPILPQDRALRLHHRQARDIVALLESSPADRGLSVLITDLSGGGAATLAGDVASRVVDRQVVRSTALPWHRDEPGSFLRTLPDLAPETVLVVGDVHQADPESLRRLRELTLSESRLVLLAVVGTHQKSTLLPDVHLHLPPLSPDGVARYVDAAHGAAVRPETVMELRAMSAGRLDLLRELVVDLPEKGPVQVPRAWVADLDAAVETATEDMVGAAVDASVSTANGPDLLRRWLEVVAVCGHGAEGTDGIHGTVPTADLSTVRAIGHDAGLDEAGLDVAVRSRTLGTGSGGLYFTDPRHRAAVLTFTEPSRSRTLHGAVARLSDDPIVELGHRYRASGDTADLTALWNAADGYFAAGRWEKAARAYRVMAMESPSEVILRLVQSLINVGDLHEARIWARGLHQSSEADQPTRQGQSAMSAQSALAATSAPSAQSYLAMHQGRRLHAHTLLTRLPDGREEPGVSIQQMFLHLADWDPAGMVARADALRGTITDTSSSHDNPAHIPGLEIADLMSSVATAITEGNRSPLPEITTGTPTDGLLHQRHRAFSGWLSLVGDDPLTARETLRGDGHGAEEDSNHAVDLWRDAWLARTHYVLGEFGEARRVVELGLSRAERCGSSLLDPLLLWTGAQVAAFQGDDTLSANYLSRLPVQADASDDFVLRRLPAAMCRMIVTANGPDLSSAIRAGEALAAIGTEKDTRQPGFWPWEDVYAQCLVRAGRISAADRVVAETEERIAMSGLDSVTAKMLVPRGGILLRRGFVDEGLNCFDTAAGLMEQSPMLAYRSRILLGYGQVLRRLGRRRHADAVFARAEEVFTDMDAWAMVERTRRERRIIGSGGPDRPSAGSTSDAISALTPQEEQIALMVADGVTNREAARELSLSTKTIEHHLTRVYRKLGVRGRSDLAEALRR